MEDKKFCECTDVESMIGDFDDFGAEFCRCSKCGLIIADTIEYTDPNHPDIW